MVVGERVSLAGLRVGDLDAVRAGVNRCDLGVDAHVEVERRLERLRGVEEELGGVFDLAADVVREPAVREDTYVLRSSTMISGRPRRACAGATPRSCRPRLLRRLLLACSAHFLARGMSSLTTSMIPLGVFKYVSAQGRGRNASAWDWSQASSRDALLGLATRAADVQLGLAGQSCTSEGA